MADIAMCHNKQCPQAETCYRHRAIPNEHWQTFADFKPNADGSRQNYWSIEGHTRLRPFKKGEQ